MPGALVVAVDAFGKGTALVIGVGVVVVVAIMAGVVMTPFLGFFGMPALLAIMIIVVSADKEAPGSAQLPTGRRVLLALPFTALALSVIAAGILHIAVWNPLAKVPGLSLDEIYAGMAAANETPSVALMELWAIFWGAAAMALPVLAGIPRLAAFFTARRIIVMSLLVVGATASFHWFAGFNMGMSLADTFMVGGGDSAVSGPVIGIIGQTVLIAAILIGLTPRWRTAAMTKSCAR